MALYDALFIAGYRVSVTYWSAVRQARSAREHVHAAFEAYMRFALDHPELYQLCFERPVPGFVPSDASMQEIAAGMREWDQALAGWLERGKLSPGVPLPQARDLLIAMMHGLTSQHMANEPQLPIGEGRYGALIPAAVELVMAAWAPDRVANLNEQQRQPSGGSRDPDR
jgi:hypothetical protein